jgi:hypothetical protein
VIQTREIPKSRWRVFLNDFSERNEGRPSRLEAEVPTSAPAGPLAQHQKLLGVALEAKGSEAPAIIVTLGCPGSTTSQFDHVIHEPVRLWVTEDVGRIGVALEVEGREQERTTLTFEGRPERPA